MNAKSQFSIVDGLMLVGLVAGILGLVFSPPIPAPENDDFRFYYVAIYLLFLAIVSVLAKFGRTRVRVACLGAAVFGWVYLILVLRLDIIIQQNYTLTAATKVGIQFLALSLLATHLSFRLYGRQAE